MQKAKKERLYRDVEFLTSLRPYRNYLNIASLNKVCDYLVKQFDNSGYDCSEQVWKALGNKYRNIIASFNEDKSKRLIIGAHYDVCGDQPGADDNASAVAGLLETARIVAEEKPEIDYGIDFVAYCLEELPFFGSEQMGSYIHAKSLHDNNMDIIGMICYEMIGYFSDKPGSQPAPFPELKGSYPDTADFIIVVGIKKYDEFNNKIYRLMSKNPDINTEIISFSSPDGLAGLSDQRNYWKFGYRALMINDTSFVRNPNYHKASDTIDTLDFNKITEVINSTYYAIVNVC